MILASGFAWRLAQKSVILKGLDAKETEFFHRIAKHRPKEIKTNLQHPLPGNSDNYLLFTADYYGEKIGSVREYRHWIRAIREWKVKMGISKE